MSEAAEVIEPTIGSNEPEKTLTQAEVDKIVADRVGRERRKFEKKYEGVDVDQFNNWQEQQANAEVEQATAKGEFEKVIKMQAEKKDAEIARLSKGGAEVVDVDGTTRYGDDGSPLTVHQLVGEFLTTNPHFVKASQGGAGSAGSVGGNTSRLKSVGDMSTAEYAEHRSKIGRGRNTGGYIKPN